MTVRCIRQIFKCLHRTNSIFYVFQFYQFVSRHSRILIQNKFGPVLPQPSLYSFHTFFALTLSFYLYHDPGPSHSSARHVSFAAFWVRKSCPCRAGILPRLRFLRLVNHICVSVFVCPRHTAIFFRKYPLYASWLFVVQNRNCTTFYPKLHWLL